MARTTGCMKAPAAGVPIGELHHVGEAAGQFFRRRRMVEHPFVGIAHLDPLVLGPLKAPGRGRIAKGICRQRDVQVPHRVLGQRRVLHRADGLHGAVVVQDHPFAAVPGAPSRADHPRRCGPRRGGAFELARRDGLLDQRVDDEPIAGLPVRHSVGHSNPAAGPAVDSVQRLLDAVGQHEAERPSARVTQWDLAEEGRFGTA